MSENVKIKTEAQTQTKKFNVIKLVSIALLTAIVAVLQVLSGVIMFGPFSITLALTPIVVGAALYGWKAGAWLGLVFGAVTLTNAGLFLAINAPGAIAVCLLKGALAGAAAGCVYKLLERKNTYLAVIAAAVVCPLVNTGVFILGCLLFFMEAITMWADGGNAFVFIFVGLIGVNFFVEFGVNLVLSPAVFKIIQIGKKHFKF
ncbi:MAG: ECF transporter S component [Ruminococcaceae bacterium]|nr:ECF transporter S component [Oscillospiraceae bacterium]